MTHGRKRGFTLLELMVSLTIGGIAISAMYSIGATMTRQYHQQHQAANALTSVRIALNQVKRDIARAGYMSTPNLTPPVPHGSQGCMTTYNEHAPFPGTGALAGVSRVDDDVCIGGSLCSDLNNANTANGFTADSVVLFGNYETSAEYSGLQLVDVATGMTVSVGRNAHAYQTDFTTWYTGAARGVDGLYPFDANAFRRVFADGRLVRIRTTSGLQHFAVIAAGGVTNQGLTDDVRVTFSPGIPAGCRAGTDGGWIAPVSAIRYYPRNDPNPPNPNPFGPMVQLVREEVQGVDKVTPVTITEPTNGAYQYTNTRVVLDYMVSFNLGFVMKAADLNIGDRDTYTPGNDTASFAAVNANPQRLRAVTIEISARTPEQDRSLPAGVLGGGVWGVTNCAGLACYQVFPAQLGAARVRTLRAEVFVPNIAYESY